MVLYFGADVHTTNYTVSVLEPAIIGMSNSDHIIRETRELPANPAALIEMVNQYKENWGDDLDIIVGYEAGCLGTSLYWSLALNGIKCVIMAPTTMAVSASDRRLKTDKRDSKMIARCLVNHNYHAVYVNTKHNEAVANYIRLRDATQERAKEIKQQILAYCHRNGFHFTDGTHWTGKHYSWLKELHFDDPLAREILDAYLLDLQRETDRVAEYDRRIEELSREEVYAEKVQKLGCFLGMSTNRALAIVSEIGEFARFEKADEFAAYLGLVPGQYSSGGKNPRLPITKAGNTHLRKLLIEAAQGICKGAVGHKSKALRARQCGQSDEVVAYGDKGNIRLRKKYYRMIHAGKNRNVAVTAVARELACFIWGMMNSRYGVPGTNKGAAA